MGGWPIVVVLGEENLLAGVMLSFLSQLNSFGLVTRYVTLVISLLWILVDLFNLSDRVHGPKW